MPTGSLIITSPMALDQLNKTKRVEAKIMLVYSNIMASGTTFRTVIWKAHFHSTCTPKKLPKAKLFFD